MVGSIANRYFEYDLGGPYQREQLTPAIIARLTTCSGSPTIAGVNYELGIIGAGNMAEAIARGVLTAGVLKPQQIIVADVAIPRRELFQNQLNIRAVTDNAEAAASSRMVLLSVKPQQMGTALDGLSLTPQTLVISIAAGISSSFIERRLGGGHAWRVVRCMPNTPMLVGAGMVGISAGANASADDLVAARTLFESSARVVDVPESLIDAVTAVSGSGPAYFFFLIEQMIAAGVELGLSPEQARLLASQTALGAARMLAEGTDSPAELRRRVTSPGGTTQAAIEHLQSQSVGPAVVNAIKAAARRSKELGQ